MTTKPHMAFGLLAGAVATSYCQMSDASFTSDIVKISVSFILSLLGSFAPDLDAPGSPIARLLFFIAKPIQSRWPHRTLLHSIIGAFISSGIVYYVADFLSVFLPIPNAIPFLLCIFFLAGHLGHLLVDSLTINGVKWIWPYQRAFAYPSSKRHRVRTGDKKQERYYTLFFLFCFLLYLPVLKAGGASRAIHRTFKNFQMAKEDYQKAVNIETFLQFKGSYRYDRIYASGKSLILDVKDQYFIVYLDGKIWTVGEQASVLGNEFICEYSNTPPNISELSVVSQPMDSILAKIPDDVLISGELLSQKEFQASTPIYTANDFPTIKVVSHTISFAYAAKTEARSLNVRIPEDVRKLQNLLRTLEKDITAIGTEIEALTEKRSTESNLLVRYNLKEQIEELKSRKESLEKNLENKKRQLEDFGSPVIEFYGKLILRKLPSSSER